MCKNFITTKIEKAVILPWQRIFDVHEIDTLVKPVQGSLLWEMFWKMNSFKGLFQLLQPPFKLLTLQSSFNQETEHFPWLLAH